MAYDYNLVIAFPSGSASGAQLIRDHTPRQIAKHPGASDSLIIEKDDERPKPSDVAKMRKLNAASQSRLFIFGHGSRTNATVGGRSPETIAEIIVNRYGLTKVTKISLIACWGGGSAYDPDSVHKSFAQKFHWILAKTYNIETEVSARTERMVTRADGTHRVRRPDGIAVKGPMQHQADGSKYIFTWRNKKQLVRPAYGMDLDLLFGA